MSVCYKKLQHKLREYPLPLKLRFGEYSLDQLTGYEYTQVLKNYCDYLVYRLLRGLTRVNRERHIALQEKVIERKQFMLLQVYRSAIYSEIEDKETGVFWLQGDSCIYESMWRIYGKEYPAWDLVGSKYTAFFDYNIVEDEWKEEMLENTDSPLERELITVDGPYSLTPWFPNEEVPYGFIPGGYKLIAQCALCGRHFSVFSYWPQGYYPKTRAEYDRYKSLNTWNRGSIPKAYDLVTCGGPCTDIVAKLRIAKLQKKYKNFPLLWIFLGVINYANYNPDLRRTAENFVRYARSFLESGSHSARREGNRQVGRQRTEICVN